MQRRRDSGCRGRRLQSEITYRFRALLQCEAVPLRSLEEVAISLEDAHVDAALLEREGEGEASDPPADNRHRYISIDLGPDLGVDLALQFGGDLSHRHETHAVASIAPPLRRGRARSPLAQHSGPMAVARKADAVLVER